MSNYNVNAALDELMVRLSERKRLREFMSLDQMQRMLGADYRTVCKVRQQLCSAGLARRRNKTPRSREGLIWQKNELRAWIAAWAPKNDVQH